MTKFERENSENREINKRKITGNIKREKKSKKLRTIEREKLPGIEGEKTKKNETNRERKIVKCK